MAITRQVEDIINVTEGLINQVRIQYKLKKPIYIAFDEYNVWYRAFNENKLEEHYNMQDVLVVAMYLNCFLRHANIVKMANMAQLVNVIAPMMVTQDKLWLQTIYFPLQMYATNCHGQSLQTLVESVTYDAGDIKDVPWLDVSSVLNAGNQELIINVVNRNANQAIETIIQNQFGVLDKTATVTSINATNLSDENSPSEQKIRPATRSMEIPGNQFSYIFPPHSLTMIKIKIKP